MSKVGIIMGSTSDLPVMQEAVDILQGFDIEVEVDIVSAHRTPENNGSIQARGTSIQTNARTRHSPRFCSTTVW